MLQIKIFLLFILCTLIGCNKKIYFTPSIKKQLINYNQPLDQVQFFITKKVTLKNLSESIDSLGNKTYSTKIIKLKKNTPGICIDSRDSLLFMQFEEGKANNLIFGVSGKAKPNEHYKILAYNWTKYSGFIEYENIPYSIGIFDAFSSLKVKAKLLKRLEKKEIQKRIMKGIKVGEIKLDSASY